MSKISTLSTLPATDAPLLPVVAIALSASGTSRPARNILTLSIEDGVTTVAISPDTKYVAAGSLDKSVRVWDAATGYLVERLEGPDGHKDSVYSVAFAPNGKDLVSGSLDKTIKMWELVAPRGGHPIPAPRVDDASEHLRDIR